MQAPFLSVWNYYPFVLSQALLSFTSSVCVYVCEIDSSAEEAELNSTSQRGCCTHLMFDLATKLITMKPSELLKVWNGLTVHTTHRLTAMWHSTHALRVREAQHCFFFPLGSLQSNFSSSRCTRPPPSHLYASQPLFSPHPLPHSIPAALSHPPHPHTHTLSLLPVSAFVPELQYNSFLRAVLLKFNPPSLPFQPLFHCQNLG